ncbi:MAG: GIY-YIG nuclease family protein [Oligoflexus sp.]
MIDTPVFLFDCQTTGSHPDNSYMIEAAWGLYTAREKAEDMAMTHVRIQLPEGETIPKRIQRLTGIGEELENDELILSYQRFCEVFFQEWREHARPPLLIHFAQFERPFLLAMASQWGEAEHVQQTMVCTHRLAKRLVPGLRSYSLRAVAGHYDFSLQELKRSNHHLQATAHIWQHLVPLLPEPAPNSKSELITCLQTCKATEQQEQKFHSKVDSKKRLALPQKAGIYRMLDKSGKILYVGKAKNLKSRVNSYFRGRASKGSRINELLTRVDDIDIHVCGSELEALLRESDEIKRYEPPYNRLLKGKYRQLSEIDVLSLVSSYQAVDGLKGFNGKWQWGPLPDGLVRDLENLLRFGFETQAAELWGRNFSGEVFQEAKQQLFARHGLSKEKFEHTQRLWQILGAQTIRERRQKQEEMHLLLKENAAQDTAIVEDDDADMETDEDVEIILEDWLADELSLACERIFCHMIYRCYQLRWLLRLVEAKIFWQDEASPKQIHILSIKDADYQFQVNKTSFEKLISTPEGWQRSYADRRACINVASYDRLGIVYRFLRRLALRGQPFRLALRPGLVLDEHDSLRLLV